MFLNGNKYDMENEEEFYYFYSIGYIEQEKILLLNEIEANNIANLGIIESDFSTSLQVRLNIRLFEIDTVFSQ